ncbi:MAG: 1-aminocyclopropane-1-carboxylate deaminase/D-cysteine desulfhydrase [Bacteroidia bacterium]
MSTFQENTPLHRIQLPLLTEHDVKLFIKRDDLIHSEVSGNKWRKLKYNIEKLKQEKKDGLLTFGGAYSNHIAATAAAGKLLGVKTIGFIRGEELAHEPLNKTLQKAKDDGMELHFISREDYSARNEKWHIDDLHQKFPNTHIVPEGGANFYGVTGCTEIVTEIDVDFDIIACACGTGTTLAGILVGLKTHQLALGFSVLKGDFMRQEVNAHLFNYFLDETTVEDYQTQLEINEDYHFGGYGKTTQALFDFMQWFKSENNIELDKVYTAKLFFGLLEEIKKSSYDNKTIIAVHTGGLQGN